MKILGIETSCDETGIALLDKNETTDEIKILSNVVASSLELHATTGGIIPENAAREQVKLILPTLNEALKTGLGYDLGSSVKPEIDAVAVTYGPGLIGPLLVGVETAKTLSYIWDIPLIGVNHMHGHIYANFIDDDNAISVKSKIIEFPALALIVSGGHTDLLYMKDSNSYEVIGGTRDDAAGEAFDKIGRLLGLPYPAGPLISKLAEKGTPKAYAFPRPMIGSPDFDFSFSGLKTSVLSLIKTRGWNAEDLLEEKLLSDLSASVQAAIVDVIVRKSVKAAEKYKVKSVILGGGVAANNLLRAKLKAEIDRLRIALFFPSKELSTDNGAMIAAAGFFQENRVSWKDIKADPELYY